MFSLSSLVVRFVLLGALVAGAAGQAVSRMSTPAPRGLVESHGEETTHEVVGRVELGPVEAELSARLAADDWARRLLARRADRRGAGSSWLPSDLEDRVRAAFIANLDAESLYAVRDRDLQSRDHGGYRSHQCTFSVAADDAALDGAVRALGGRLDRAARRVRNILLGTPVFWGLLVLLHGWFDRITRGYMPWRGRLACVLMALAGPAAALTWGLQ